MYKRQVDDVADAMYRAATLSGVEAEARHEKHWRYISEHTVGYWAASNIAELQRATEKTGNARCYGLGFGLNFRVVALDPNFRKLETARLAAEYATRSRRVLLLDYDGTLVPQASYDQPPSEELLSTLRRLTEDPNNAAVCIVSGRQRATLDDWFGEAVPDAGFLAEHGYWYKAPRNAASGPGSWRQLAPAGTEEHIKKWHAIVMPILEQYTDSTDGAFIKDKGTSVIWHFGDADPDFGAWQAKELMDHLESVLVNDPVDVFPGNGHVEIKPQGVSKGTLVEMLLGPESDSHLRATGGDKVDFVLAVGDDRSDEEMFHAVADRVANPSSVAKTLLRADSCPMPGHEQKHDHLAVYLSTVGQKPSKADFYLDDPDDVVELLGNLTARDAP